MSRIRRPGVIARFMKLPLRQARRSAELPSGEFPETSAANEFGILLIYHKGGGDEIAAADAECVGYDPFSKIRE